VRYEAPRRPRARARVGVPAGLLHGMAPAEAGAGAVREAGPRGGAEVALLTGEAGAGVGEYQLRYYPASSESVSKGPELTRTTTAPGVENAFTLRTRKRGNFPGHVRVKTSHNQGLRS